MYFTELTANALKMADTLIEFDLVVQSKPFELDIDTQLGRPGGVEITDLNQLHIDPITSTLSYQGRNIVLYIPDHSYGDTFDEVLAGDLNAGKKFHLTFCETLDRMKRGGRFERYRVNKNEGNLFEIVDKYNQVANTPLLVCIPCLKKLNYKNYNYSRNRQNDIRKNFNFKEFLQIYTTDFSELPSYAGQDKAGYTSDWVSVSMLYRASKNYTCESCGVNLTSRKGLLHTHHISGNTHDNRLSNLKAVCVLCHHNEPYHGHMAAAADKAKADVMAFRRWQNLY